MADAKLTALTEDTSPSASGLIYYVDDPTGAANPRKVSIENFLKAYYAPDGTMVNGKFSVTVSANDLIVALKTIAGTDPSATDPVYVRINGTVRKCTAALSKTLADGTNWFNSGAAEFAAKEVNYFAYAIWNTTPATDIVDLGFARVPYFSVYSEASATTTNEKYLAYANASAPTSTDDMVNIGRFAATLSAGAGYTWTVPTFTSANLIQRPIYESEWKDWLPTITGFSANPTGVVYRYKIIGKDVFITNRQTTNGTSNATTWTMTAPFTAMTLTDGLWAAMGGNTVDNGTGSATPGFVTIATASNTINVLKDSLGTAWTNANGKRFTIFNLTYPISS